MFSHDYWIGAKVNVVFVITFVCHYFLSFKGTHCWEEYHKAMCPSQCLSCLMSVWSTCDVHLDHLAEVVSARPLHGRLSIFFSFVLTKKKIFFFFF